MSKNPSTSASDPKSTNPFAKSKASIPSDASSPPDPTLDITSEKFDPLKALYAPNVVLPIRNAQIYDNIGKFESIVFPKTRTNPTEEKQQSKNDDNLPATGSAQSSTRVPARRVASSSDKTFERRFLPHQSIVNVMKII